MGSNKLFEAHEKARAAAEQAVRRYEDGIKKGDKGREPDNEGNLRTQNKTTQREIKKGK